MIESVSSLKNEGISSAILGEPAGDWERAFQGEFCLHGCCPPLPPSLSSSLFLLLLLNNIFIIHILIISYSIYHSCYSSENSGMLAITQLSKNLSGPISVCVYVCMHMCMYVYTLYYIKCLCYLGNCSY